LRTATATKTKWVERKIGDDCIVGDGAHAKIQRQTSGVMYLTCKNFKEGGLDLSKVDYISELDYLKYFRENSKALTKPKADDVVFSIIGTIGEPYLVKSQDSFGISSSVAILRPNKTVLSPKYIYYWIKGHIFQNALYGIKGGVAQGYVSLEMIRSLPLYYPELAVQEKIAAILSAYDRLIENNTRRIEILEEMARSLYREWFVKFRFPGHEQVQMVDSELGPIPEGWRYSSLKNLPIQFIDGDRSSNYPKRSEFVDNGIIFLSTKNINQDKIDLSEVNFITREKFEGIKKGRVQPLDIVMTTRGSIGKIALFNCEYSTALINAQMLIIRADDKVIDQIYLFYLMCSNEYQEVIKNFASGSAQPQIPIQDLKQIEILCPPIAIQRKFSEIVSSYNSLIKNLQSKNTNLRLTRDLLLPRLISGEIDVENLDIKTGEVAA